MMGDGEDDDLFTFRAIVQRKGEAVEHDATRICDCWRSRKRKGRSPCGRRFDRLEKACAETRLGLIVISDLRQKLATCLDNKPHTLHRVRRLASANTSAAG